MRPAVDVSVGFQPEPGSFGPVTQTDIVRFAGAAGDFNPLHHDADYVSRTGFRTVIAMGQLQAGILAGWLTDWCGVEHLRSFTVRFSAPVSLGDELQLSAEVIDVRTEDGVEVADLAVVARCGQTAVVHGTACIQRRSS
ncbi:MAG: MaoC protein dehydratase [Marmoricola sp.]|nr:MaoC protein dehydratase [Marmoricola sp.]